LRICMRIRRLTLDDYEAIIKLWKGAKLPFKPRGRDSKESISGEMTSNPEFFLGAFDRGRLIGVVILSCDMRRGWINRLAVDPEYRGQGVATALIAKAERTLRTRGVRLFCVLIDADNTLSKELFKKCGYVEHHGITYFSKRDDEEI
jgi:ribosomal protein S18 acetylase RimI-like enzyme